MTSKYLMAVRQEYEKAVVSIRIEGQCCGSKAFRIRISGTGRLYMMGNGDSVATLKSFPEQVTLMKKQPTPGMKTDNAVHKQSTMESSIVDIMHRYFQDDKDKMGDMAISIMESLRRYFQEPPPKKIA